LQEAFSGDGSVVDVARRHDILPQQIYAVLPAELQPPQTPSFVPVSLIGASESVHDGSKRSGARWRCKDVEIVLRNGRLLRIAADMDLEVLSSLVACVERGMIGPSGNVRVYLACGVADMRRGIDGLSALVEAVLKEASGSGAIFGFRGKRADRIKLLWWDGQGFCLFYKILERGYFP
jgi:hypothetical protein